MGDKLLLSILVEFNNRLIGIEDKETRHCKDLEYVTKHKLEYEKTVIKLEADNKGFNITTIDRANANPSRQNTAQKLKTPIPASKSKEKDIKNSRPKLMSANFNASTPSNSNLNLATKSKREEKVNSTLNSNSKSRPLSRNDTTKVLNNSNSKLKGNTVVNSGSKSKIPRIDPTRNTTNNSVKLGGVKARQKTPAKKMENGSSADFKSVITTDSTKQRISNLKTNLLQVTETSLIEVLNNDKLKKEEEDYQRLTGKTPDARKESITTSVAPLEKVTPIQFYNKVASPKGSDKPVRVYSQYTLKEMASDHLQLIFNFLDLSTKISFVKLNKQIKTSLTKGLLTTLSFHYKEKAMSWNAKLQDVSTVSLY